MIASDGIRKKSDDKLPVIAKTLIQVGTAGIDFYTFGHIIMGILGFTIMSNFVDTPSAFSFVQLGAVAWELFENIILFHYDFKFEGRRDSGLNAILDIAFMDIGAGVSFFLYVAIVETLFHSYEIFVLINLLLSLIILIIFYFAKKKVLDYSVQKKYDNLFGDDEEIKENLYLAQTYKDLFEEKIEKVKKKIKPKKIDYDLL